MRPYEDRVGRPLQPEARAPRQRQRAFARLRDVLEVRVCGGVEVEADRRVLPDALFGGRQGRLVFAFLVCERHRAVRREELADLLWPEPLPESWSASLSAVVSRLRRLLTEAGLDGPSALVSAAGSYQLLLPPDADRRHRAARGGGRGGRDRRRRGRRRARAQRSRGRRAGIAARGFLTDDCDWVDRWRASVRDLRVRAALARSVAHLAAGSSGRAVEAARDALALDPSREAAFRQLMRALAAAGERGEALRVWERCRITLVEELGVDPAPETEAVYLEILGSARPRPRSLQRCRRASSRSSSPTSWSRRRCGRNTPQRWRRRSNGTTRSSARSSPRTAARC